MKHSLKLMIAAAALSVGAAGTQAAEVDDILKAGKKKLANAQASQKRIDKIAAATDDLVIEFNTLNDELDDTKVYNRQKRLVIAHQQLQMDRLRASIAGVQDTERRIPPLIERMIVGLEQHIAIDLPFNMEEREERVERFRNNIGDSGKSVAEKFRQVLEAYRIELEYGNKIDTYVAEIQLGDSDTPQEVNIFRLGRTALVYQTKDKSKAGVWDQASREWTPLDASEYRNAISTAIRIAKKTATLDIMTMPVKAPEAQ